jgi:alpha-galactosidase
MHRKRREIANNGWNRGKRRSLTLAWTGLQSVNPRARERPFWSLRRPIDRVRLAVLVTIAAALVWGLNSAVNDALTPAQVGAADGVPVGFVTRNGMQLERDGQPFKFTGLNIYNANSRNNCGETMGSGTALSAALTSIRDGSNGRSNVIRAWFFQSLATVDGHRDWSAFDHTLSTAKANGFLVIPTLGNHWADCESLAGRKSEAWYRDGYTKAEPVGMLSYRTWVGEVVNRYKDDPTIALWQLMNEAETSSPSGCASTAAQTLLNFANDMASLVKSIDNHHLLSVGTMGSGQCGASGDEYRQLHALPGVDLCEYHDYGSDARPMPGDSWNGLRVRIEQCRGLDKPMIIGEAGIELDSSEDQADRAQQFAAKLDAQFSAGISGYLVWGFREKGGTGRDSYAVEPGDPILNVIGRYGDPGQLTQQAVLGAAGRPPMGFNPYNAFGNSADEEVMRTVTDKMVSNGMRDAGYVYVNIDDSWQGKRDSGGNITANANFPNGIKALSDYVHARGMKLGIYTTPAAKSCAGNTGSAGYVQQDVNTFAAWEVDFIKLDWCNADYSPAAAADIARTWSAAIDSSGREMILSINAGGDSSVGPWAAQYANMWRTGDDICASWFNKTRQHHPAAENCFNTRYHNGIYDYIVSSTADNGPFVGPGHWADADMLEVGNPGLSPIEAKSHFSLWAMWSSPLIAGNDPRSMNPGDATSQILLNREVIAIDQDPLGAMARKVEDSADVQVWVKPLAGGTYAVLGLNTADVAREISINWEQIGLFGRYDLRDVWTHAGAGTATDQYTRKSVPGHGVIQLVLTPVAR